jgi:hypothetical protein
MANQRRRINRFVSPISGAIRNKSQHTFLRCTWARFLSGALVVAFIGQYGSAQACQQRIGGEPCEIWQQIGDESNDYCSKPIPCLPGPRMTSCPDDFCARPTPCVTVPTQSSCADDYCSKPLPKLCPTPPVEIQESRKRPKSKPVVHQSCSCRSRPFSIVGGMSCCQDDYCRKPLPSLRWPQLCAPTGCGAAGCPCDAKKR